MMVPDPYWAGGVKKMEVIPAPNCATALVPLGSLKPKPLNPRTHNRHQLRKLQRSIRKLGIGALLADRTNTIIAGHARGMDARDWA